MSGNVWRRSYEDSQAALTLAQSEISELRTQLAAALKGRTMSCICGGEAQRDSELSDIQSGMRGWIVEECLGQEYNGALYMDGREIAFIRVVRKLEPANANRAKDIYAEG